MDRQRQRARELAQRSIDRGDAVGWFEELYRESKDGTAIVPWADLRPNPMLVRWCEQRTADRWRRIAVVGCGLGDDAEYLADRGDEVVAFDISPTAIDAAQTRFPATRVRYAIGDAFDPPPDWIAAFDLVVEIYTLQVLPPELRPELVRTLTELVTPAGALLVITRGRNGTEPPGELPWPLTRDELDGVVSAGLRCAAFEDFMDDERPPVRRFVATFTREVGRPEAAR